MSLVMACLLSLLCIAVPAAADSPENPLFLISLFGKGGTDAAPDAPATAYSAEFWDVNTEKADVLYLTAAGYTEDGLYATGTRIAGKNIPEGAVEEYEGQFDVYEQQLVFIGYDGQVKELDYTPLVIQKEPEEGQYGYTSSCYAQSVEPLPGGGFAEIAGCYETWSTVEGVSQNDEAFWDHYGFHQDFYLRILDATGAERKRILLPVDENSYIGACSVDGAGNIAIADGQELLIYSPDGEPLRAIDTGSYIDSVLSLKDGSLFISSWGDGGQALRPVTAETGEIGNAIRLPNDAYQFSAGEGKFPLYYSSGSNFFGFDPESGENEKIFNWLNIDVASELYGKVCVTKDDTVIGLLDVTDYDGSGLEDIRPQYKIFEVKNLPVDPAAKKISITLASQWPDYQTRSEVLKFNRGNDKYHIDIIDYSEYNSEEDYSAGLTKLQTEIMAGQMPDILDLNGLPVGRLAAKELLEDLYPWMDADPGLNREDYFPNVLAANEQNGKLVSTMSGFSINSLIGASSVVGEKPGWTYQEFNEALAGMPAGCRALSIYTTRGEILSACLNLDMGAYVDWETGKCSFDSRDFIDLLNFVKQFPAEYDWSEYDYETDSDMAGLASGEQMLAAANVYSLDDVMYNEQYFGGPQYTYIGYPTNSGTGNFFSFSAGLALSAKSDNKEAAWQFLRTYFTEEYQKRQYTLPISKAVFEAKLEDAMKISYRKGADGKFVLDENGEKIPVPRMTVGDGMGNTFDIYALSEEEADKLKQLMETTTRSIHPDESIVGIVQEAAEAFFQSQKSAEAVAKLIQSRVSLYVNEQR